MQINDLKPKNARTYAKRVGRGGKRGKTSGRGTKGQKARAGHRIRPEIRDRIRSIPKLRGHGKNRARTVNDSVRPARVVNLSVLETHFESGDTVSPALLASKGLVRGARGSKSPVKILGTGSLTKALSIEKCLASKSARAQVEKAGGSVN